jgi:quercetin dioxygenase-like cupin family protein
MKMPQSETIHHWNDTSYRTILATDETEGAMAIIYGEAGPFSGPAAHFHDNEDEIFIVLEGEVEFELEGERFVRGPLGTAFLPRGKVHSFRTGPNGARCLTLLTPGGFEGFFAEMAKSQYRLPQDIGAVAQVGARYGSHLVGPGLAQREQDHA